LWRLADARPRLRIAVDASQQSALSAPLVLEEKQ
jgi:hypothetical protein